MTATPLQRELARNILELLRDRGAAPGARISRAGLAEALGVSRTPVHGAVALLEALGAVATEGRALRLIDAEAELPPEGDGEKTGVDRLLVAIAQGRSDGRVAEEVSERQLAQQFAAPRGAVAQALAQLAEAGVVSRNRGHGWRFTAGFASRAERAASYRFRMLIEPPALLEPTFALPAGFAARMRAEHHRFLERTWHDDHAVALYRINAAFHEGLAEASGNRFIAAAVAQQNRVRLLSNYSWRVGAERVAVTVREHLAILDALEAGDQERAALLMRLHLADALALRQES